MSPNLTGKICLVTGAARGIGRGIAVQLGAAGATVYITGRTKANLDECAADITARGGNPVLVQMDHANDADVENLFSKIKSEQGRLDLLVNNAYAGVNLIFKQGAEKKKFYETDPVETWDTINGVGLRNHYLCTTYASRIMVPQKSGLIINISSFGGLRFLFNVAYGVGKAACDRMVADCAIELKKSNVTMISLWPGAVKTEFISENILNSDSDNPAKKSFEEGETTELSGIAIANMLADPNIMAKTGKIVWTVDCANEYGFKDVDGSTPRDVRQVYALLKLAGWTRLSNWVPGFIRIPNCILHFGSYKF